MHFLWILYVWKNCHYQELLEAGCNEIQPQPFPAFVFLSFSLIFDEVRVQSRLVRAPICSQCHFFGGKVNQDVDNAVTFIEDGGSDMIQKLLEF